MALDGSGRERLAAVQYADAMACFRAALGAVDPRRVVVAALTGEPLETEGRLVVASIGKAAAAMAQGALDVLGDRIDQGVVIAPVEVDDLPTRIRCYRGGHPIPNAEGVEGARDLQKMVGDLVEGDLLLGLISGGGSALMTLPPDRVSLSDVRQTTDAMLRAGADIVELNALRKHADQLKGGRLAELASPGTIHGLVLSDVVGDPLDAIASGPLSYDPTTFADVAAAISRLDVGAVLPESVSAHIEAGLRGEVSETPSADAVCFERAQVAIVGNNRMAADAACAEAESRGYVVRLLSTQLTGEARNVGAELGSLARTIRGGGGGRLESGSSKPASLESPTCVVAAGETIVTVRGDGVGGRNQELALAAAIAIDGLEQTLVASLGTDGIDGPTDAAGAIATGRTLTRARAAGLDAEDFLRRNDSYPFFAALDDLVIVGPTGTNVMDLQFVFVR